MPITIDQITIASFREFFRKIIACKEAAGVTALHVNPSDLLDRAKTYGTRYTNGSWGWASNIWHRSAANSVVVNSEDELKIEHRDLMLSVLERIMCVPMIQVDQNLGTPGSPAEMRCRMYCDPQFPDIAYRWGMLNFPGDPAAEPEAELFMIPHFLNNPNVPGKNEMLRVIRFPHQRYTIVTASSYQGEAKKGILSHWIYHVYKKGGTGEHAALKEFTIKRVDGTRKRIVLSVWGLTGSGKSTHGLYVLNEKTAPIFVERFGVDVSKYVSDEVVKNDDIVAVFRDRVYSPESGAWTKTEDVDQTQPGIFRAAMAECALHENTEWDERGYPCFEGKLLQHRGKLNRNARTVLRMADTGYFDGSVDSTAPLNMAIFISPGYITDFAWLKLNDPSFAAKVLADGRTTGHPAQSSKGVGEEKYESRYCLPFTMGVGNAAHVHRFYEFMQERVGTSNPIEVYQFNTTGRVGSRFDWIEQSFDGEKLTVPKTQFEDKNGKKVPVGGTAPSIAETELFLYQAARGAVEYEPHPVWGNRVLVPVKVEGLPDQRLKELNPFTYNSLDEMKRLLHAQIKTSRFWLAKQCPGLSDEILNAMDF